MTAPEYPYPSVSSTQVPDRTDVTLIADLRRQVQQQLTDPVGARPMVVEVGVNVGNLIDDPAAKASIGAAADRLHSQAHGE
jgi:phage baseplate assembly protein W